MRLAILIQCHKNPDQINALIQALCPSAGGVEFYIHIDANSSMDVSKITAANYVHVLRARIPVVWGTISQVDATLLLVNEIRKKGFDYVWLMSGQDYPLVDAEGVQSFLNGAGGGDFIDILGGNGCGCFEKRNEIVFPKFLVGRGCIARILKRAWVGLSGGYERTWPCFRRESAEWIRPFYFGSSWWIMRGEVVEWMMQYVETNGSYYTFFQKSLCPDESFFQTLYMKSPFKHDRLLFNYLYVDWGDDKSSPKILGLDDVQKVLDSGKILSRKWDFNGINDPTLAALQNGICYLKKHSTLCDHC